MPLTARRYVRKMRGGAQSHLLEASDEGFYVVKFQNNPQHRRILVNELIAAELLRYLQIPSPECAFIEITEEFLEQNPEVHLTLGSQRIAVKPGWHFGSKHPGHPDHMAIYDFVPDALLNQVINVRDFLGVLVFDKWAANADGRQSIFFRANVRDWRGRPGKPGFIAWMIDHGFIFDGPNWDFHDSPVQGLYPRRMVYEGVRSYEDFQPWLELVRNFPADIIDRALKQIPPQWVEGEEDELDAVLNKLYERRRCVADLLCEARRARISPFPNWVQ